MEEGRKKKKVKNKMLQGVINTTADMNNDKY